MASCVLGLFNLWSGFHDCVLAIVGAFRIFVLKTHARSVTHTSEKSETQRTQNPRPITNQNSNSVKFKIRDLTSSPSSQGSQRDPLKVSDSKEKEKPPLSADEAGMRELPWGPHSEGY